MWNRLYFVFFVLRSRNARVFDSSTASIIRWLPVDNMTRKGHRYHSVASRQIKWDIVRSLPFQSWTKQLAILLIFVWLCWMDPSTMRLAIPDIALMRSKDKNWRKRTLRAHCITTVYIRFRWSRSDRWSDRVCFFSKWKRSAACLVWAFNFVVVVVVDGRSLLLNCALNSFDLRRS